MSNFSLFPEDTPPEALHIPSAHELGQYPTPGWYAQEILEYAFPEMSSTDHFLDPTCGPGPFLSALPDDIPATGVDIDPRMAEIALAETGRRIIVADVRTVELTDAITAVIGNPPFQAKLIDAILDRCYEWLPEGGKAGFILPAYYLGRQPERFLQQAERWSIQQELVPQSLFKKLSVPLTFCLYQKTSGKKMHAGFALFEHVSEIRKIERAYQQILSGTGSVWTRAVAEAIRRHGGVATLRQIYDSISSRRPKPNPFWKERIRETCQSRFHRVARGTYALLPTN